MITKTCYNDECSEDNPQPLDNFHKQATGKHGRNARCRVCVTEKQLLREKRNLHTIERRRNSHYLREYGISLENFESIRKAQKDKCKICGEIPQGQDIRDRHLVVDHCHTTGAVRGLLCNPCNRALGIFNDDPKVLDKAAAYLRKA